MVCLTLLPDLTCSTENIANRCTVPLFFIKHGISQTIASLNRNQITKSSIIGDDTINKPVSYQSSTIFVSYTFCDLVKLGAGNDSEEYGQLAINPYI